MNEKPTSLRAIDFSLFWKFLEFKVLALENCGAHNLQG